MMPKIINPGKPLGKTVSILSLPTKPKLPSINPGPKKKTNPTIKPSIRCFIFTVTTTQYLL